MMGERSAVEHRRLRGLAAVSAAALVLGGCGGGPEPAGTRTQSPTAARTSATPPYKMNLDQVEKRLVGPKEIGSKVRPTNSVPDFYRNGQVPLCSLSSKQPTGTFDATVREYANSGPKGTEVRYAQFIATFKDTASASRAYNDLKKNAEWCPGKKHIDGKRVSKNDLRLPHDDTWKLTEPITAPWLRFHAVELQKYDRSAGEYNWLHAIYDYATQGNLLISTIYMGRTEPDGTSKPIEDRAERIFTEQLDKLG